MTSLQFRVSVREISLGAVFSLDVIFHDVIFLRVLHDRAKRVRIVSRLLLDVLFPTL